MVLFINWQPTRPRTFEMGTTISRKGRQSRKLRETLATEVKPAHGVEDEKAPFTESSESADRSDTDDEWNDLPPFPDRASFGRHRTRNYHYLLKLVFIGNSKTGKTSLLTRMAKDTFSDTPHSGSTLGIDFKLRTITIDERWFKLQMWDVQYEERSRTLTSAYYRGTSGVFIVYDALNEATFSALPKWINSAKANGSPDIKITLLGNKCDLKQVDEGIAYLEAKTFADEYGIPLFEVSAKDGTNVECAITHMIARIWRTKIREKEK